MLEEKNIFPPTRGVNFLPQQPQPIEQGLDFMLWHFQGPLWPRNVSTAATRNAQKLVDYRDRAILYFQGALRQDCKIACYHPIAFSGSNTLAPTHLFIDLDLDSFAGDKAKLELALAKTLRNIARQCHGAVPTVLWSGGGYHVHLPLDPAIMPVYEELAEFKRYKDPSIQFMRYAEQMLSGGKADRNHRISFASCMARLPGSRNSKYEGDIAEVKIIQPWNGIRARPAQQFMLTDFLIWLVQADLDARERLRKQAQKFKSPLSLFDESGSIAWIDRLLQTPIPDCRKTAVGLILAPYLIGIKQLSYEQAFHIIMEWAARCDELSSLRPKQKEFVSRVHASLKRAHNKQSRPLKWTTLVENYSQIYEIINKQAA